MDTRGYSGRITKTATVHTNDPKARSRVIALEASIQPLISVKPPSILLQGKVGQVVQETVEIRGAKDRPLGLQPIHFDLTDKVTYSLEEVEPEKFYRAHFSNAPGISGFWNGQLMLKTNYPEKPEIRIGIRCKFGP